MAVSHRQAYDARRERLKNEAYLHRVQEAEIKFRVETGPTWRAYLLLRNEPWLRGVGMEYHSILQKAYQAFVHVEKPSLESLLSDVRLANELYVAEGEGGAGEERPT